MPHKDKEKGRASKTKALKAARIRALAHYSNGEMVCACCKEHRLEFLCLDHVNGGGTQHRKIVGSPIWYWLSKNNYPEGFQVLCHNCNCAKGFYGECPHERERK